MSKLLEHFKRMQDMAASYSQPNSVPYVDRDGTASTTEGARGGNDPQGRIRQRLFAHDMIYMLDGPEQREAQAEAQSMADQGYPTEDAYLSVCRALHWREDLLRANGLEPVLIAPDAPHYPPDDHDFGVKVS